MSLPNLQWTSVCLNSLRQHFSSVSGGSHIGKEAVLPGNIEYRTLKALVSKSSSGPGMQLGRPAKTK